MSLYRKLRVVSFFIPEVNMVTKEHDYPKVDWEKEQIDDRDLIVIKQNLQEGKERPEAKLFLESPTAKYMWINTDFFSLKKGIIHRQKPAGGFQRVVPQSMK